MNNLCGLTPVEIRRIIQVLSKHPHIERGIIFGSRAKGNYRNASDVDLVIIGDEIEHSTIVAVSSELNNTGTLPYHFDILQHRAIKNSDLLEHIARVGVCIYTKGNNVN